MTDAQSASRREPHFSDSCALERTLRETIPEELVRLGGGA